MAKRTISDEEIGLIKAMLGRGMKNRDIQFYFNRPDRPVNSGRITQIGKNTYGPSVPAANDAALDDYLKSRAAANAGKSSSSGELTDRILEHFEKRAKGGWFLKTHESDKAECKASFALKPDNRAAPILRAIAALANNAGGFVFFGVEELADKSLRVAGLAPVTSFTGVDPAELSALLASTFDPVPRFTMGVATIGGQNVGVIEVPKHVDAPVVALKNVGTDVKEGSIYYRYVGQTRTIRPGELRSLLLQRERRAVEEFARAMARVASGTMATVDLQSGEVAGRVGSFLIDKRLMKQIQFIKEGEFKETAGAPALRLIGEVTAVGAEATERTKIVRHNVTADAVIRNMLAAEAVDEPLHYILFLAHATREWLPIWYYVNESGQHIDEIIVALKAEQASQPSHRDSAVARLLRSKSAFKEHAGSPRKLLAAFRRGEIEAPTNEREDTVFALAVQGLPEDQKNLDAFRIHLVNGLDRARGDDAKSANRRSTIYRAVCRLDELLYRPPPAPGA